MTEFAFQATPSIEVDNSPMSSAPIDIFPGHEIVSPAAEMPVEVNPVSPWEHACFYVKDTIAVNDSPTDEYLYVDITLQVSNDGKFGAVTKRLKFAKASLMGEMKATDEIKSIRATVVESKQPEKSATQRMLELSGIKHPKNFV